jgi:hypothetical protein
LEIAWLALKVSLLTAICSIGPGLLIVRLLHHRCSPLECLCAVPAASFVVTYLVSFGLFLIDAPPAAYWTASAAFALMGLAGWRTARLLWRRRVSRAALSAMAMVLIWELLHLAMVRHYNGGDWAVDWAEQFQRTAFFLHEHAADFAFVGEYALPARPPMMNLLAAFICRQSGFRFESFSLAYVGLNSWTFLPCCLLLRRLAPRGRRLIPLLLALFMLNPSIMQNATLTTTKAFTAGWVVLGVCFYLRGRVVPAAGALAAGMLSHYSAGPFAAAIAIFELASVWRGRRNAGTLLAAAVVFVVLLATWLVWSGAVYGWHVTLLSNTTATGAAGRSAAQTLRVVLNNLFTSLIPHPLRPVAENPYVPIDNWGTLRDYYFMMCQTSLPTMIGLAGGAIAAAAIIGMFFFRQKSVDRSFWRFFLPFTYVVGIAVCPDPAPFGCAQVTLQALALMGVTLVAAMLPRLKAWAIACLLAGLITDYWLGIFLHFDRQARIYPAMRLPDGRMILFPDPSLGRGGFADYQYKIANKLVFWGDHLAAIEPWLQTLSAVAAAGVIYFLFSRRSVPGITVH